MKPAGESNNGVGLSPEDLLELQAVREEFAKDHQALNQLKDDIQHDLVQVLGKMDSTDKHAIRLSHKLTEIETSVARTTERVEICEHDLKVCGGLVMSMNHDYAGADTKCLSCSKPKVQPSPPGPHRGSGRSPVLYAPDRPTSPPGPFVGDRLPNTSPMTWVPPKYESARSDPNLTPPRQRPSTQPGGRRFFATKETTESVTSAKVAIFSVAQGRWPPASAAPPNTARGRVEDSTTAVSRARNRTSLTAVVAQQGVRVHKDISPPRSSRRRQHSP